MSDNETRQDAPAAGASTETPTAEASPPQPDFGATGASAAAAAGADAAGGGAGGADGGASSIEHADLDMLRHVELRVTAELGRAKLTLGEVTGLSGGSIVTLDKAAGEPVDLRINDQLFASGEVIVMDGYFAVKITKLLSREERMKRFS